MRYDIDSDQCVQVAYTNIARRDNSSLILGSTLYVIAGRNSDCALNSIESLDVQADLADESPQFNLI